MKANHDGRPYSQATPTPAQSAQIGMSNQARWPWKNVRSAPQKRSGASTPAARDRERPRTQSQYESRPAKTNAGNRHASVSDSNGVNRECESANNSLVSPGCSELYDQYRSVC